VTGPGRLILPALRWQEATGFSHEADAIARALAFGAGGFIVFGGTAESVRTLTAELERRAGRRLLFAADLERGAGQQFRGLTEFPPPAALAALEDPAVIRWAAAVTAHEARSVGVQWVLAPVADLDREPSNPIVQTRAFSADAPVAAAAVSEWIGACQRAGALAAAKHWPGHGATTSDSHDGLPVVADDRADLARDLMPFRAAVDAGVAAVMTAHVAFPGLDPSGLPATFSAPILSMLRTELRFDGAIVTDALIMEGAAGGGAGRAAVKALAAGCDLLLYPEDPPAALAAIDEALDAGRLSRSRVEEALGRYEGLLARATTPAPALPSTTHYGSSAELADRLLALPPARGEPVSRLSSPISLTIIDDDAGGRWPAGPTTWVEEALRARGVPVAPGGRRIVLAFTEPRASKGRVGFSAENTARLAAIAPTADAVILFGHPRLAAEIPGSAPVIVAWHRQRLMQEAAARWIAGRRA
jgi:beta-glucosidase